MSDQMTIRRMRRTDIPAIVAIEEETFPRPWKQDAFESELDRNPSARYLVLLDGKRLVAYGGAWVILDEAHMTNIAVQESYRGKGCGRRLLHALMAYLSNLGVAYVTLEVRKSNLAAQKLYASHGFIKLGVRKRYYEDNHEDALIMVCDKMPPVDPEFDENHYA